MYHTLKQTIMIKDNLKILQFGKFFPIKGGVEKVAFDLMSGLSEQGIKCDMMCAATDKMADITKINEYAKLICCKTLFKYASTMISPNMIKTFKKECNKYNIIHIHHPDPMAALTLYLSGYKGRVILHWHSDIIKQKILLKLYHPLQNWLLKRANTIIGTSPVYVKESPFLQDVQNKILSLPIGVAQMQYTIEEVEFIKNRYSGKKIIFSLGRLVGYKGYKYLIEAANYLNDDFIILIGGTGPLKEELQTKINERNLQNKVKLLGFIQDNELAAYYKACELFCLPSIQKTEAFGIVQIEAMSLGKPIIATMIPESGVSWVNEQGISGINVKPQNAKEIAQAIQTITSDINTYKTFSERALERYKSKFTKNLMIENCLKIYLMQDYGNKNNLRN